MQTYTHKHDLTWKALMIIILCLISSSWERYVGLNSKHQIDIWYNVICNCDLVTIPLFATRMQTYTHEHDLTWRVLMIVISCLIFSSWEPYVQLHLKHQMDIWYNVVCSNEVFKISSIVIVPPSFTHAFNWQNEEIIPLQGMFNVTLCCVDHLDMMT
jgi:hypothetical protein